MPQGGNTSSGHFVKVLKKAARSLNSVAAFLDDVIAFEQDLLGRIPTTLFLFEIYASKTLLFHLLKYSINRHEINHFFADPPPLL